MRVFNDFGAIGTASNILIGGNPPFSLEDFYEVYPHFKGLPELPVAVIEMYISFANECVNIQRWDKQWKLGMCLFVAHFCTLHIQSAVPENSSAKMVIATAQTKGLISSKGVGDVNISYDFSNAVDGLDGWGGWKITSYGLQFASIARFLSKAGMYIY